MFTKQKPHKVANAFYTYARLLTYVRRFWVAVLLAMIGSMLYSGVDAWFVHFLQPLLNDGLMSRDQHFLRQAPVMVLLVFVLRGIASFFSNYYMASASRNVILCLRQDLFAHLQRLPAQFYDHRTTGQILATILYSVEQVASASADVLTTAIQASFLIIGLVFVMFSISWQLTLLYFVVLPIIVVIIRIASTRIRRLSLSIQDSVADITHCAEENIEGYKVVRAFAGQAQEIDKFNKATRINRQREMKVVVARSISLSTVQLITAAALAATLYLATLDVTHSILTPGGFVSMVAAMLGLLKPMKDLAFVQNKLYRGLAGAQAVFELLDETPEADMGNLPLVRAQGDIKFEHANFSYQDRKAVLRDINLTINAGEVVAFVGKSGSGKTTLIHLLPRFYDQYTGNIYLDGHSLKAYRLQDLRQQFAIVSQHVTLFHDTIFNNIAYGQFEKAATEQVIQAARAAYAMEFIEKLPDGLQTLIGENGVLLSGGQRQRIAIARAILKDAPILILDEATSSLDTESERYIQAALEKLMKTRTTLVIAHRLSTIEHADKIVVMDEGKIIEVGTHHHLLARASHYAALHHMQFSQQASPVLE